MVRKFLSGDVVEILPGYLDSGDEQIIWIVEGDEEKERVTLIASNSQMSLKPRCVVQTSWIQHIGPSS
jgi:hypothetical protein